MNWTLGRGHRRSRRDRAMVGFRQRRADRARAPSRRTRRFSGARSRRRWRSAGRSSSSTISASASPTDARARTSAWPPRRRARPATTATGGSNAPARRPRHRRRSRPAGPAARRRELPRPHPLRRRQRRRMGTRALPTHPPPRRGLRSATRLRPRSAGRQPSASRQASGRASSTLPGVARSHRAGGVSAVLRSRPTPGLSICSLHIDTDAPWGREVGSSPHRTRRRAR